MTIWTSSAPTTPTARCHLMQLSAMFCTWWRRRTMRCVNLTPLTNSVGSARGPSLPTHLKNSLRSSSASHPSPWARSSDRERAIIISVSIIDPVLLVFYRLIVILRSLLVLNLSPSLWPSPAKPMHHHGQDCLRLRVDVVGNKGSGKSPQEKSKAEETGKSSDGGKVKFPAAGGVHNPSNQLPAGEESFTKYQTDAKYSQQGRV